MFQYVDSFTCALNEDNHSIVIHFNQKVPYVNEVQNGQFDVTTRMENVVSLMMDSNCAQKLVCMINDLYEDFPITSNNDVNN